MENLNFIPHWYKSYKEKRMLKIVKITIGIFMIFDFLLFIVLYRCTNIYNNSIKCYNATINCNTKDDRNVNDLSKKKIINNYKTFMRLIDSNISYKSAVINVNTIEIEILYSNFNQYYNNVSYLEDQPNISINSLSPSNKDKDESTFNVVLGVKN